MILLPPLLRFGASNRVARRVSEGLYPRDKDAIKLWYSRTPVRKTITGKYAKALAL